jgi:hypothetical protein
MVLTIPGKKNKKRTYLHYSFVAMPPKAKVKANDKTLGVGALAEKVDLAT